MARKIPNKNTPLYTLTHLPHFPTHHNHIRAINMITDNNNTSFLKEFIDQGGEISFPYKKNLLDWYEDLKFTKHLGEYVILGPQTLIKTGTDFNNAINQYSKIILSHNNLFIIIKRLTTKNMWVESNKPNIKELKDLNTLIQNEQKLMQSE